MSAPACRRIATMAVLFALLEAVTDFFQYYCVLQNSQSIFFATLSRCRRLPKPRAAVPVPLSMVPVPGTAWPVPGLGTTIFDSRL